MAEVKTEETKYNCIKLSNQFCFPLYACAKEVVRRYRKPLDELNLTYTQYLVMMVLWEHGGMTEQDLGKKVLLGSGTLAPLLKRMEKQGMVSRERLKSNERLLFVNLTEEGEALKDKAVKVPEAMQGCIDMPEDELRTLWVLLNKALSSMPPEEVSD